MKKKIVPNLSLILISGGYFFLFINSLHHLALISGASANVTKETTSLHTVEIEKVLQPLDEQLLQNNQSEGVVDINSIDDGLLTQADKDNSDRHHYEQQNQQQVASITSEETTTKAPPTTTQMPQLNSIHLVELTAEETETLLGSTKPEPRNQQDVSSQLQIIDPIIIDHRPGGGGGGGGGGFDQTGNNGLPPITYSGGANQQVVEVAPTQSPQQNQATTTSSSSSSSSGSSSSYVSGPISVTTQPIQYQATPASSSSSSSSTSQGGWLHSTAPQPPAVTIGLSYLPPQQQHQQQVGRQQQQQQSYLQPVATGVVAAQQHYGGSLMSSSSSNQQHPTSINSIINDNNQQQQQQQSIVHPMQQQQPIAQASMQVNSAVLPTQNQQTANSQQQMVTVNGQPTNLVLIPNPNSGSTTLVGGRRISTWLRGISSMLANIFNRREHGFQQQTGSHWILGAPNSLHWLSQAQSVLQQQQQQQQQQILGAGRQYATTTSTIPVQQQQQQQQPASSTMTITMQPATILSGQAQQISTTSGSNQQHATVGDLQASASTQSYPIIIQAPNGFQYQQQQQQYQQPSSQTTSGSGYQSILNSASSQGAQPAQPVAASQGTTNMGQIAQTNNRVQPQQAPIEQQVRHQHQQHQQHHQKPKITHNGGQQQQQQLAAPTTQTQTQTQTQSRYGRSSSALASINSSNLPLAHYSRFESNF